MPSVNKVIIVGNLTRDPVTRSLPTQSMVTEFGLAMSRKFKAPDGEDKEEVCFVDCAAFGRQAEVIQKYCKKGKSLYVEGRMRYDSWDDKNGHGKRSKISIVVENFQFLGGAENSPPDMTMDPPAAERPKRARDERGVPRGSWDGANLPERPAKSPPQSPFGDALEFKESDIPF